MASWLADAQGIALIVGRKPSTIRTWASRYPDRMPRRGTGKHNRALYSIKDAEETAAWLAELEQASHLVQH